MPHMCRAKKSQVVRATSIGNPFSICFQLVRISIDLRVQGDMKAVHLHVPVLLRIRSAFRQFEEEIVGAFMLPIRLRRLH
jgi:hypothetical protein